MKTCKDCKHFNADDFYVGFGDCSLMEDSNKFLFHPDNRTAKLDRCYGWDYEGYSAGVYVGKDFGCIHWKEKK